MGSNSYRNRRCNPDRDRSVQARRRRQRHGRPIAESIRHGVWRSPSARNFPARYRYTAIRSDRSRGWNAAGGRFDEIFVPGVESVFYWFSQGCPRLISLLADPVLLAADSKQIAPISADFVELKAKTMGASRAAGLVSDLSLNQ
jgi:hypothetical protein